MEAKLCVVDGAQPAVIRLKLPTVIGRSRNATLKIKSAQISRSHCEIDQFEGELTVRDLDSSNGTFVNGHRIDDVTFLSPGDELRVGPLTLRAEYEITPPAAAPDSAAPDEHNVRNRTDGSDQMPDADPRHVVDDEQTPQRPTSGISSILRYEENDQGSFLGIEEVDAVDNPNQAPDVGEDAPKSSRADQAPVDIDVGQNPKAVDPADSQLKKFFQGL